MSQYLEQLKGIQKLIFDKKRIDIFPNGLQENSKFYQEIQNNDEKTQKQVIELLNDLNASQHKSDIYTKLEQFKILEQQQILIKEDIQKLFVQLRLKQTYIIDQKEAAKIMSDNLIKETSQIQNQIQLEETQGNERINQINMEDIRYMRCKLGIGEGAAASKIAKLQYMIRNNQISPEMIYYNSFNFPQNQLDELKIWLCNHQFRSNSPNIIETARQIFNSLDENKCQNYCSLIRLYYAYFKSRFRIYDIQNNTLGFQEQLDKTQQAQNFFDSLPALKIDIMQIRSEIQILNCQYIELEKEIDKIRDTQNLFKQQKQIFEFSEFGNQKFNFLRYHLFAYVQNILNQQDINSEIKQEIAQILQMNLNLNFAEILNSQSIYSYKDVILKNLTETKENQSLALSAIYNPQSIINSLEKLNQNQNNQESWFSVRVLQIAFNIDQNGLIFKNNLDFIKIFSVELNKYQKGKAFEKLQQQKLFQILKFNGQNGSTLQLYNWLVQLLDIPTYLEIFQYGEMIKLLLSELFINESIKPQLQKIDIGQIVSLMKYAPLVKILEIFKQNYIYFSKQQKYYEVVQQSIQNQNDQIINQLLLKKQKDDNINFANNSLELIKSWQVKIELISNKLFDQIEKMNKQSKLIELFKQKQSKGRNKPIFSNIKISDFDYLKKSPLNNRSELHIYQVLMILLGKDQFSQDSIKSILSSNKGYYKLKQIQAQDIQIIKSPEMDLLKTELIHNDNLELLNRSNKKLWKSIKKIDLIYFKNSKFEELQNQQLSIHQQLKLFEKLHQFTVQLSQKDLKQIFDQVDQYNKKQILEYSQIVNQNQGDINKIRSHKYNSKDVKQLLNNLLYLEEAKIIKYSQDLTNFLLGQSQFCDQMVIDFLLYFKNFSNIDIYCYNNKLGTILIYLDHYYQINEKQIKKTNNEICVIQQQDIQQILLYQNFMQKFDCNLNQIVGVYSYINLYQYDFKSTLQTIIQVEQQIDKSSDSIQSDLVIQIQIISKIISKLIQKKYVLGVITDFLRQIQQIRQQVQSIYDLIKLNVQIRIELTQDMNIDQFQKQISETLHIQLTDQFQLD